MYRVLKCQKPFILCISIFLFSILCLLKTSFAQEGGPQRIVIYTGECRFQLIKGFFPCDSKVVYTLLKNGRTLIAFMKDENMFTVVGGADRQPNLENYYVSLDKLIINKGEKVVATDSNMEGECHFHMNRDATKFYSITCDIYNRSKGSLSNFYLENIRSFKRK
jgi:hypothetical protein